MGQSTPVDPEANSTQTNSVTDSPVANAESSCRMEELLPQVTARVREFVENVSRFTATEVLERESLDRNGKLQEKGHSKSNYVATIEKTRSGVYIVEEFRNETHGGNSPQVHIAATGAAPAMALIFHPSHIEEFNMKCEGLTDWQGRQAWRVSFEQRLDRPATMCSLKVGLQYFSMLFRGDAWIDSENYQIIHMETDLLQPIPELKLHMDHQSVDYRSVEFTERDINLWLPAVAEVMMDFKGHRLVERHTYDNFRLFYVDTGQKIEKPKNTAAEL